MEYYGWNTYGLYGHKNGWFSAYGICIKSNSNWNMHMALGDHIWGLVMYNAGLALLFMVAWDRIWMYGAHIWVWMTASITQGPPNLRMEL